MKNGTAKDWKKVFMAGAVAFVINPASAEIVSTEQALTQSDRDRVRTFMQREGVEHQLKALGLAPELARQRVDALTDEEVLVVAGRIDSLPAGGAVDRTDLILILLLVLLIIILA
jgi:hypothetical protein